MNKLVLALFMCLFTHTFIFSQTLDDYRSANTGNWNTVATWQRFDGTSWVAATVTPTSANGLVTIQSPHTVTLPAGLTVSIDQVTVSTGATLQTAGTASVTIANSAVAGPDLIINGTFNENGTTSVIFPAGSTWAMGANGTYIKTRGTGSNNWQGAYDGGIANIPATSNWILRKVAAANPTITTIGGVYGNLTIENNNGGVWNTATGSTFNGSTSPAPVIKGNLDIGGTGTAYVNFLNQHTIANPTRVQGNTIIRLGSTLTNTGTGLELQGNLTVNGSLRYGATGSRQLNFTGSSSQAINIGGAGFLGIYNFTINKPANTVTLNAPVTVDNLATFTAGIVNSSNPNYFILAATATTAGASNTSFVNGPVRYSGFGALTFPVGKVASYRPVAISAATGTAFYTEDFNTGAPAWTLNVVTGAEGADPNFWQVDDDEGGVAPGGCGVGNNGNPTLHVTSVFNPGGGAAYDAGGLCGFLYCPQASRRCESPVINCTGYNGIGVYFNYIENGDGLLDNATLWYFDGTAWSQLDDMPKTALCGAQGTWTRRIVALPASANNNANVRIAFRWVNNDDGAGTDPSFAVDDVSVGPITQFTAEYFPVNPQPIYGNVLVPSLTNLSNCEYWILNRDIGQTPRSVTLSWNAASCNITTLPDLRVARYDGISTWQDEGNGGYTGSVTAGTIISGAPVANFSPFTIANTLPLPVELTGFEGSCNPKEGLVNIEWSTSSEINNHYFSLEASADLVTWREARRVNGAGNSNTLQTYSISYAPEGTENYYRLVQVDFDGKKEVFGPVHIPCESSPKIRVFPNPTNGMVNIDFSHQEMSIPEIYNIQGQKMMNISMTKDHAGQLVIADLSMLEPGMYYIRCFSSNAWTVHPVIVAR